MGKMRNAHEILVGLSEANRPLGRPRCTLEYKNGSWGNRVGRCGLDATGSGQEPVAGSCELSGSIKDGEFLE